jgi:cytoskeletal protein RodZ
MFNIFSEELKNRREEVGLSIQQIASKTRIDKKYLEFMEQGNFSFLPELYVKSFIREYASVVDLDPEETIKKYQLAKEGKLVSDLESEKKVEPEIIEDKKFNPLQAKSETKSFVDENVTTQNQNQTNKKNGNLIIITSAVLSLLIIFIVYFFITSQNEIIVEETPFEEIRNQDNQRFEESSANFEDPYSSTTDSLSLELYSRDTTWIYLILDNSTVNEFILYPNSKKTIKAKSIFEGTIGNSGSTTLKLDDKNLDFLGRTNLPRHFRLKKSEGLEYLNSRPLLNNQDVSR